MKEVQAILSELCCTNTAGVLVTLTSVEGSSYRRPGARMLVTKQGKRIGSISGGCLEEDLMERCKGVAEQGTAEVVTYDTSTENDLVWGVGLGCHGVVKILLEPLKECPGWARRALENLRAGEPTDIEVVWNAPGAALGTRLASPTLPAAKRVSKSGVFSERIEPPTALTIFGAGDDALPLARMALEIGWRLTVADVRPLLTTADRFPGAFALEVAPAEELVRRAAPALGSVAVVMTHHYRHDLPILRELLPLPLAYVGLLGPKRRSEKILSDLVEEGFNLTDPMRLRLHAPVGLDLGADTPEEVALCIMAEIQTALSGRDARPLRERELPIHA